MSIARTKRCTSCDEPFETTDHRVAYCSEPCRDEGMERNGRRSREIYKGARGEFRGHYVVDNERPTPLVLVVVDRADLLAAVRSVLEDREEDEDMVVNSVYVERLVRGGILR